MARRRAACSFSDEYILAADRELEALQAAGRGHPRIEDGSRDREASE
jgi:hypothetical protein